MTTLLTAAAAAELLGIHPDHLYRLARRGDLPALRFGRDLRFEREAVLAAGRAAGERVVTVKLPRAAAAVVAGPRRARTRQARLSLATLDPYADLLTA